VERPRSFVKWAGGKKQLLPQLVKFVPQSIDRYLEPFVGGGALLFKLLPDIALINDSNEELINTYLVIRDNPEELINDLGRYKNNEEYYYEIRSQDPLKLSSIERASRLIYLNRTCFNGLWRVNKKNQFNTPFGRYENPKIVNPELIRSVSMFLKKVSIYCQDFETFLDQNVREGDFIYLDPPYHPISKYSDFKRYTKIFFDQNEQVRLAKVVENLNNMNCKFLLSNSESELIRELYSSFEIIPVLARRNINKNPNGRKAIQEVLIRNYE
jgi:DNA adenine methylase